MMYTFLFISKAKDYLPGWVIRPIDSRSPLILIYLIEHKFLCSEYMDVQSQVEPYEFSCVAALTSGLHQLSKFVNWYWKSEFLHTSFM